MDRYTKAFVAISLLWFALAAALGGWLATTSAPAWAYFGHVHFNLLGLMAMMIYGVGYFILLRFNARPLAWPGWVPVHFWVSNIGLVGLVATYPERPSAGFSQVAAAIRAVSQIALANSQTAAASGGEAGDVGGSVRLPDLRRTRTALARHRGRGQQTRRAIGAKNLPAGWRNG